MSADRIPLDEHLERLGRTSQVELAIRSLDALLAHTQAPPPRRAPLPLLAVVAEHVRERLLAERDAETGLKSRHALKRALHDAARTAGAPPVLLLVRVRLTAAKPLAEGPLPLLRELALVLQDNVARSDLVARTAERELTVLIRGIDPRHAPAIGSRLTALIEQLATEAGASVQISLELLNNRNAAWSRAGRATLPA